MKPRKAKQLSAEDRELWDRIRKSVTPLKGTPLFEHHLPETALLPGDAEGAPVPKAGPLAKLPPKEPFLPPYRPPVSAPARKGLAQLDDHTVRRLKKGRLEIEARIDLHGLTQNDAHHALYRFLENAQSMDMRIVLVITGKGRSGDGVLRRTVPMWLGEPLFHRLVGGYRQSHVSHGGEGAIYVRIRRHENRRRGGTA